MSEPEDFEAKLGLKVGKIKLVIPSDGHEKLKLTLEKRSQNGANTCNITISGRDYGDQYVRESVTLSWDAIDAMIIWLSGGPRKNTSRTCDDSKTLKRQMGQIRLAASLFRSSFKRLERTLDEHEVESQVEKENSFPMAQEKEMDF